MEYNEFIKCYYGIKSVLPQPLIPIRFEIGMQWLSVAIRVCISLWRSNSLSSNPCLLNLSFFNMSSKCLTFKCLPNLHLSNLCLQDLNEFALWKSSLLSKHMNTHYDIIAKEHKQPMTYYLHIHRVPRLITNHKKSSPLVFPQKRKSLLSRLNG